MSDFAFVPKGGRPPRLIRLVPAGDMPSLEHAATYDRDANLVVINETVFLNCDAFGRRQLERATGDVLFTSLVDLT